ncbi:nicotinamidase/pyrazinamidase [Corynebacterium appendicis CIP 107643]|uniref:nicotinamidase n=1 Tax=Corynebacterium appendicis CIP 107643 TaxID=1161099 RepID=A0A1N7K851_9CORY|nr:nicotinamidase [Corynebacterium appendicis]WJY61744.1 nicotinamidase/pyrazinamidase [Corynebacterium appendicis CIP 107643]SIS57755.1 nicotinamidase/pyrazinamidase [Corynebacterium appendicis CIP 107643]
MDTENPAGTASTSNVSNGNRALVVVDVQNDFCPGGALGTARGDEVASKIAALITEGDNRGHDYSHIVATQDWHIDPGAHFSDDPDFVDSWPVHCVAESEGAALRGPIADIAFDEFFRKGEYEAAYSGFEGASIIDKVLLADWLRARGISDIDVVGIATDHCVRATVLDARKEGFGVRVLRGMCSPVDDARGSAALEEMRSAGAELV